MRACKWHIISFKFTKACIANIHKVSSICLFTIIIDNLACNNDFNYTHVNRRWLNVHKTVRYVDIHSSLRIVMDP